MRSGCGNLIAHMTRIRIAEPCASPSRVEGEAEGLDMGLDMYLRGEKFLWSDWNNPANNRTEDGFKVSTLTLELGYWRKHPNLHGYIVNTFAEGVDECQRIDLNENQLQQIIDAVNNPSSLPHTEGFFFGQSDGNERDDDVKQLTAALEWLTTKDSKSSRSVFYEASW